mgnify:CR=1 FL=1
MELLDGSTPRIQLSDAGIQIGSVANGITLSSDGDATFSGDLSAASGSITGSSYQGGSINIGDGTFSVNNFGDLTSLLFIQGYTKEDFVFNPPSDHQPQPSH